MHPTDSMIIPQIEAPEFIKPVEKSTTDLAEGLDISQQVQMVAWMEASRMPVWAIEQAMGLAQGSILTIKAKNPHYRIFLERCIRVRAQVTVQAADGDIDGLFNDQIEASAATLMEVRDNPFESGNTRMKAANAFLDRASKAPKVRKEVEERRTIISIPVNELKTMQQALLEEGTDEDNEILDLLKGVDYKLSKDEDGKNGKEIKVVSID